MENILLVIHLLIALFMIVTVLLQKSEGGGLGIGGGGSGGGGMGGFLTGRGTANVLTRTTAILATLFMISSLGLTIYFNREAGVSVGGGSLTDQLQQEFELQPDLPAPGTTPESTPPASGGTGSGSGTSAPAVE